MKTITLTMLAVLLIVAAGCCELAGDHDDSETEPGRAVPMPIFDAPRRWIPDEERQERSRSRYVHDERVA